MGVCSGPLTSLAYIGTSGCGGVFRAYNSSGVSRYIRLCGCVPYHSNLALFENYLDSASILRIQVGTRGVASPLKLNLSHGHWDIFDWLRIERSWALKRAFCSWIYYSESRTLERPVWTLRLYLNKYSTELPARRFGHHRRRARETSLSLSLPVLMFTRPQSSANLTGRFPLFVILIYWPQVVSSEYSEFQMHLLLTSLSEYCSIMI